jgi:hypothetical protein
VKPHGDLTPVILYYINELQKSCFGSVSPLGEPFFLEVNLGKSTRVRSSGRGVREPRYLPPGFNSGLPFCSCSLVTEDVPWE